MNYKHILTVLISALFISGFTFLQNNETGKLDTKGTVIIIESEMEKNEGYDFSDKKGIIISGEAKYIPSETEPKAFSDFSGEFRFILVDSLGNKVRTFYDRGDCGLNGNEENVKPNEPFPFEIEKKDIDPDDWNLTYGHEFVKWY